MSGLSRREFLRSAGAVGAATLVGVPITGCAATAAVAPPVLKWLATVAAAASGQLIADKITKSGRNERQWTPRGQSWKPRYDGVQSDVFARDDDLKGFYFPVYGMPRAADERGAVFPGGCAGAFARSVGEIDVRDPAIFVTGRSYVRLEWWAMQGITALLEQTDRKGIDDTARVREKKLFRLAVLPAGPGRLTRSRDQRAATLEYPAGDRTTVTFHYLRTAADEELVTVRAPGFPEAHGRDRWDVSLTRSVDD